MARRHIIVPVLRVLHKSSGITHFPTSVFVVMRKSLEALHFAYLKEEMIYSQQ